MYKNNMISSLLKMMFPYYNKLLTFKTRVHKTTLTLNIKIMTLRIFSLNATHLAWSAIESSIYTSFYSSSNNSQRSIMFIFEVNMIFKLLGPGFDSPSWQLLNKKIEKKTKVTWCGGFRGPNWLCTFVRELSILLRDLSQNIGSYWDAWGSLVKPVNRMKEAEEGEFRCGSHEPTASLKG